ncbi:MAG: hypothetical protein AB7U85_00050 [Alphaproteobacteria bacterium]
MAMPQDLNKRPVGAAPQGAVRPPNANMAHAKKPLGQPPLAKKPPMKGAPVKRPISPAAVNQVENRPHGNPQAPHAGSMKSPIAPPPPMKSPIAPPPPLKSPIAPPPPLKSPIMPPEPMPQVEKNDFNASAAENAVVPASPFTISNDAPISQEEEIGSASEEKGRYDNNFAADLNLPPFFLKTKVIFFLFLIILGSGIFAGKFFGQTKGTVVAQGLQGVVENPEVPRGRLRCGIAEKGQGCILYIVNPERRELEAREFYSLAAQLTGVQEFLIKTGNMRYANTRIRPGHFAQINIPPIQ